MHANHNPEHTKTCANPEFFYLVAFLIAALVALISLAVLFTSLARLDILVANDWYHTYYPAARAFLRLENVYQAVPIYFAPPWTLVPLIPFALLPIAAARALFFIAGLFGFSWLAWKINPQPAAVLSFLFSAPVACCLIQGNVEWLPLLGLLMPPQLGLIFLAMKPQTTIAVMVYVIWKAYRQHRQNGRLEGLAGALATMLPTICLFLASWALYGPWFLRIGGAARAATWTVITPWPWLFPLGLALLYLSIRLDHRPYALAASLLLTPYAIPTTWSAFMLAFIRSKRGMFVASLASWIGWLVYRFVIL